MFSVQVVGNRIPYFQEALFIFHGVLSEFSWTSLSITKNILLADQ
jgi:hypothetical protein